MNEKLKEKIKTFSERTPNDMASKLVNARELIDGMATFIDENFKGLIEMKRALGREKDLRDIRLIEERIK